MKLRYNIIFFAIGLIILSSCSSTRYVPGGDFWLKRTRVKFDNSDAHLAKSDVVNLQKQKPNERFLWYPLRLQMYSSVNIEKTNWWSRFMQKAGEPPVIFDSTYANQTVLQMKQYLINKGHFNSSVYYACDTLSSKAMKVVYYVSTGKGYHYRNVSLEVKDDSLANLFRDWPSRSLIKPEQPYDVEVFNAERLRVVQHLQNQGYYFFNKDNIEFLIDSTINEHFMDVKMVVNPPKIGDHNEKYSYGDVYIFPDERPNHSKSFDTTCYRMSKSRTDTIMQNYYFIHTKPLQIKPNILVSKLLIQPGDPYRLSNIDQTYENLLDLRVFKSTNIAVQPQPIDTNSLKYSLNTTIEVQQALQWTAETNFDLTTSSGLQGASANIALLNRNLFGGAEIFSLRLRGLIEMQYLLNKEKRIEEGANFVNNFDVGLSANLDIPRFIGPFNLRRTSQNKPRTLINIGYSYQFRPGNYNRQIVNTSFAYSWRQPRVSHILFPIDVNSVKIFLMPGFAEKIDTISHTNKRLQYQYANHFIFAARYGFAYSGQQNNRPVSFNAFRFSIESSGNALYLLSHLTDAPKNGDGQYQFFNLGYAQYIRIDGELKRYWYLADNKILVTRLMAGSGFTYGNSVVLPYEKGFFAGGNNNIRAWPMNQLGPGSYYNPTLPNIERVGDIVAVGNIEYRFPVFGAFKGALFVDAGNIWLRKDNESFPNGEFVWKDISNDLAVGGGIGLRWDLGFFIVRLDAAVPLRDPAKPQNEKWVISKMQIRDLVLNFGIGYPF